MNHRPKKRLGQHFLHQPGYLQRILAAIQAKPGQRLLEIGPGEGVMTLPLLRAAGRLNAIEVDCELAPRLQQAAQGVGELHIVRASVLDVDLSALADAGQRLRIVGNLPYYISTPILFHCLRHIDAIADMHFMLQKEVVERMAATPGGKVYGRLSVMLQLVCRVDSLFTAPPEAFRPPPKVDSALVRLQPLPPAQRPSGNPKLLHDVVKAAFAQRRKTLGNSLRELTPSAAIAAAGIDPRARAETLSPQDFVRLAQQVAAFTKLPSGS